jgi:hypothetical protein
MSRVAQVIVEAERTVSAMADHVTDKVPLAFNIFGGRFSCLLFEYLFGRSRCLHMTRS